jgi:hypothetical protein
MLLPLYLVTDVIIIGIPATMQLFTPIAKMRHFTMGERGQNHTRFPLVHFFVNLFTVKFKFGAVEGFRNR